MMKGALQVMFEKLGKARYAIPVLLIILIFLFMSIAVSPILRSAPQNVPFAVMTLDAGTQTPAGDVNIGTELLNKILSEQTDGAALIKWTQLTGREELEAGMATNDYYGAIVVPADYTVRQAAAVAGQGDFPEVEVVINQGKNVMLSSQMQSMITTMLHTVGFKTKVTLIHNAGMGGGMTALMGTQMLIMPMMMMIIAGVALIFFVCRSGKEPDMTKKLKTFGFQIAYAAGLSLLMAVSAVLIVTWPGGMILPVGQLILFLWPAAFCVMTLLLGALNVLIPLGVLTAITFFTCGMPSAMLAPETMPGWYRTLFYPWMPQRFLGEGVRAMVTMGGVKNSVMVPLLVMLIIGLAFFAAALFVPQKTVSIQSPTRKAGEG
jgi:hypothetical protein